MIIGLANYAKTFLLNPFTVIYNTFCNPASGSFAWVGVQKVYIRNPSNPKRELSFLEKIISCIKISKQLYKIDLNLT